MSSEAAKKDLKYYLDHPDEMPTDPVEIERLSQAHMQRALEGGGEDLTVERFVGKADETPNGDPSPADKAKPAEATPAAEPAKAETPPAEPAKPDATPSPEKPAEPEKPQGVLAADGKNVIPYAVLASAREREARAQEIIDQQRAEIERLRQPAATPAAPAAPAAEIETLSEDELSALEQDSPTLAKMLRSQQAALTKALGTVQQLSGTVTQLQAERNADVAREAADVKSEVQQAIEANPTLKAWQDDADQTMWDRAAGIDKYLRTLPEYANVSFEDRFNKVVEMTRSLTGQAAPAPASRETPPPAPKPEEVKAAAQAVLEKKSQSGGPRTLSDIPGGAPPAVDERQRIEEMSSVELGNKFMSMTPDQIQAYLNTL